MTDPESPPSLASHAGFVAPARQHHVLGSPELRRAQKRHFTGFFIAFMALAGFCLIAGAVMGFDAWKTGRMSPEARNLLIVGAGSVVAFAGLFWALLRD